MPGNYSLTITAKGFAAYVQKGIVITVDLYATQDVHLKLASAANETVTVTADAELINTTSAELGSTVNEAAISELPLDGRDPSSLVLLAPGTVNVLNHGGEGIQTGFSFPTETGASSAAAARAAPSICSTASPTWTTTTCWRSHSRTPTPPRSSRSSPATTARSTALRPARWSPSPPRAAAIASTAAPSGTSATTP